MNQTMDTVSQSQSDTGARVGLLQQDCDDQQQETVLLLLPHLNCLQEPYIVWGEDASNVTSIPTQNRLTHQIIHHFQPFKDLKETFVVSHRTEQLCLRFAGSFRSIRLGTTSALVPPTRVPRRLKTGRLIKLLTSFAQPTK